MKTIQLKSVSGYRGISDAVLDGSNSYERCSKCGQIHLFGWPCYHCTVVRASASKRDFVNWLNPPAPKYLAATDAQCRHCGLWILERMRGQTFHPECKAVWAERKRTIFKVNQLLWHIRKRGYYWLDGRKVPVIDLSDESILVAIGQPLPLDLVYEKTKKGNLRFRRVEFRPGIDHYPWKVPKPIPSVLSRKRYAMWEA